MEKLVSYTITLKRGPRTQKFSRLTLAQALENIRELNEQGYKERRDFTIAGPNGVVEASDLEQADGETA